MKKSYCELKNGKIKFGGYKGGLGYCGWYTTKDKKDIFLRSLKEFFISKKLDYENKYFLMEKCVFYINGKNYKPDFFIYESNEYKKIIKIIEVKNSINEASEYFQYKDYFNRIGIEYEVIYNIDVRKKVPFITKEDITNWKNQYIKDYNFFDFSGEKNPMYGLKHTDNTKKKIGEATIRYFKIPEVKEKHRKSREDFWNSEKGKQQKIYYANLRRKERELKNPIENRFCVWCDNEFSVRKNNKKIACGMSCIQKYNRKIGKNVTNPETGRKSYKNKLLMYAKHIGEGFDKDNFNEIVSKYKEMEVIPKNFGMSVKSIEKYFGTFEQYVGELNWEN